jgi:hypothetical protein
MVNYTPLEQEIIDAEKSLAARRKELGQEVMSIIAKKVKLRNDTIQKQFNKFIEKRTDLRNFVYLNDVLLNSAVKSYYYDIHKYKDFSDSMWANNHKQAAYTIKWLVRFRPVQIKENIKDLSISEINLRFALFCGFVFLDTKITDLIAKDKRETDLYNTGKEDDKKKRSFLDTLLYDLRYRQLSGKKLTLVFEALQLATTSKTL